ncbi:MAG: hypothetical protein HY717_06925 [Planctomycetes bacterium]|nr:hypothetical protein [Planctomycetota bacterium]
MLTNSFLRRFFARTLWILPLLGIIGCAEPVPVQNDGLKIPYYTRYTMRGQPGITTTLWRSNYIALPVVAPPGSKVEITMYSGIRVDMNLNGIPSQMFYRDLPFLTTPEGITVFLSKHFAKTKEELNLDQIEKTTFNQITSGTPAINMSKEDVLMALGYPSFVDSYQPAEEMTREQILEKNQWIYRYNEIMWIPSYYVYQFGPDGKLVKRTP